MYVYIHVHRRDNIYIYIYIYIYILSSTDNFVISKPFSVGRPSRTSSQNRNPVDFMSVRYLTQGRSSFSE